MIGSRSQWVKFRDNHADSPGKGAAKSVSVGDLVEKVDKAFKKGELKGMLKANVAAQKGFAKYHKAIVKNNKKFAADFKSSYLDEIERDVKSNLAILKPAEALKNNIKAAAPLIGAMKPSSTHREWGVLHKSDPVRLVAMNLGMIVRNDATKAPKINPILSKWKSEMNKILPDNVPDNSESIWAAVTSMRKAFKNLVDELKKENLI